MTGPPREVEVVVDRLVLDGVDEADVDAVEDAFRVHLTVLAGGDPSPVNVAPPDGLRRPGGATADGRHDADAVAIGRRAAAAVWRSVARHPGTTTRGGMATTAGAE